MDSCRIRSRLEGQIKISMNYNPISMDEDSNGR